MTDTPRSDFIAAAWNDAYQRAQPPSTAYSKAQAAGFRAAIEWDTKHGNDGQFACVARAPGGSTMIVEVFATEAEAADKCRKMFERNPNWQFSSEKVVDEA